MSITEVEKLLKAAVVKIKQMETNHKNTILKLEKRIEYLEEKVSSQKIMLNDSMQYLNSYERNDNGKKKA